MNQLGWQLREWIREWVWAQQTMSVLFPTHIEQVIWPYEYVLRDKWPVPNDGSETVSYGEPVDIAPGFKSEERWR